MTDTPPPAQPNAIHFTILPPPLLSIDQPRFQTAHDFLTDLLLVLENRSDQPHPFLLALEEVIAYVHDNLEFHQPLK